MDGISNVRCLLCGKRDYHESPDLFVCRGCNAIDYVNLETGRHWQGLVG